MTTTLADLAERTNVRLDEHLNMDEPLPVRTKMFAQGDLLCIPLDISPPTGGVAIPRTGTPVIRGNHDHVLTADPDTARWIEGGGNHELSIGVVVTNQPAWLLHAEHGGHCLAPGVWEFRGQRESAREGTRRVLD